MNVKFIYFLVLMGWCLETYFAEKNEVCIEEIADVGFIMDSSHSLGKSYIDEKEFLKALTSLFRIKLNSSRAGVITFSHYTEHSIKLNQFSDIFSFNNAVNKIPLMGHTTRIDKALRLSQKEMFKDENGGRPGVSKLLILLTDGSQTQGRGTEDPVKIANEIRKEGIPIIAIGIGSGINKTELSKIGGGEANTYSAETFKERGLIQKLKESDLLKRFKKGVCDTAEGRSFVMDIVFAMDLSSSSNNVLQKQKMLIESLIEYFLPSQSNELGLVTYSDTGNVSLELCSAFNNEILDRTENNGRRQNISSAITVVGDIFKKRNDDDKLKNKLRVLILFVVGKPTNNPPVVSENYGKLLNENDVQVITIGLDEVREDFNKNMPGSKLLKYSDEDEALNELKGYIKGWHDSRTFTFAFEWS